MAFDQSAIASVSPPASANGQTHLSWTSTAPAGSWYQVYVDRKLAWFGRATSADVPAPGRRARVDVGVVGASERAVDFSASLLWLTVLVTAGPATLGGQIIAAALLAMPAWFTTPALSEYQAVAFGAAAVLLAQSRNGIVGLIRRA